ncbi:P-loop containing nucleoside triphosphate hydrolase protein [Diplogelasinospora grovesii]|uniref:small monomeric GTPase n=1 Tax=Diplogelasinospora grovesii TaxID=303347 RepID=A0AAN6NHJ9_9PEZI|nr:P-loop containing nucleoside triphosphate hydrolase protein [Diplogelasinospora grovesii]
MVNSFVWTDEEAKYLKAVLKWQDPAGDDKRRSRLSQFPKPTPAPTADITQEKAIVGEFRILVIGAKGVGKTSILTRFGRDTFDGDGTPDPFYERGCRHPVDIDGQLYMIDALEMPSKHLSSNPMLEQALNITEAAVLVYDVTDEHSLKLAKGIAEFVKDTFYAPTGAGSNSGREYGLVLVGNKSDAEDDDFDRAVSWSEGSKAAAAASFKSSSAAGPGPGGCQFIEVSARTGENVNSIFPTIGREVLRLKRLNQQRREEMERVLMMRRLQQRQGSTSATTTLSSGGVVKKRGGGLWKTLTNPFMKRQAEQGAY